MVVLAVMKHETDLNRVLERMPASWLPFPLYSVTVIRRGASLCFVTEDGAVVV